MGDRQRSWNGSAWFFQLWRIADSEKIQQLASPRDRLPIGQFGIGKLAAYVLAKQLTHISRKNNKLLLTVMNFNEIQGRHNDSDNSVVISLREIDEITAKDYLSDIEHRDSEAWELLFGNENRDQSWTVAGLSDFRNLYNKLEKGRLRWVISTGLPLHTDFIVKLNGKSIESSKENKPFIQEIVIDQEFEEIGKIKGRARIYENPLTSGKSDQFSRSNGFFVRVRKRVINLEDPFFGLAKDENWQPNQSAWSRFALKIDADGLQAYLLSSREGVKEDETIRQLREFLRNQFNKCRAYFDEWNKQNAEQIEVSALLSDLPNAKITETLFHSAQIAKVREPNIYFINSKEVEIEKQTEWLEARKKSISEEPFKQTQFKNLGPYNLPIQYDIATSELIINNDHPFINKLTRDGRNRASATLFAFSEVLLPGQLQNQGISQASISNLMEEREEILRITAGEAAPLAKDIIRQLKIANSNSLALERATGAVFRLMGFEYEERGGNNHGPDGVLSANLGRHSSESANYKLVYDAKQTTDDKGVPASKINLSSLERHREKENADFGFFIAIAYQAESKEDGTLNEQICNSAYDNLTLLKIEHLEQLVKLHYKYGITLSQLRSLFEETNTAQSVTDWIQKLKNDLRKEADIPLDILLQGLEEAKSDLKSPPNVNAVRAKHPELEDYEPDRLIDRLSALQTIVGSRWIEVDKRTHDVHMHQTADQILKELEKQQKAIFVTF